MQNGKKSALSEKKRLFCGFYVSTGNAYDAALLAGYKQNARLMGEKLLSDKAVLDEIEKISGIHTKTMKTRAICGYERLAFGNVSDAVKLLFIQDLSNINLNEMDLFNVSEIRKLKDGAMEIKFFDRLKALEKLDSLSTDNSQTAVPFYKALEQSAKALDSFERGDVED